MNVNPADSASSRSSQPAGNVPSPTGAMLAAYQPVLRAVLSAGPAGLSRAEIARQTGLRPNTVGDVVRQMIEGGWLRHTNGQPEGEATSPSRHRGRPAVGLGVDPGGVFVVGMAIQPARIEAARCNLLGELVDKPITRTISRRNLKQTMAALGDEVHARQAAAVGISATGSVDERHMHLLFSRAAPDARRLPLGPLLKPMGPVPVVLENDAHALGDRWRVEHPQASEQAVLLIRLEDGAVGASIMPPGRPAEGGVVRSANELGHMQTTAAGPDVARCYCGQSRCLERVFSSAMVGRLEGRRRKLRTVLAQWSRQGRIGANSPHAAAEPASRSGPMSGDAASWISEQLAIAVANAVNLTRPHRVVWTGLSASPGLIQAYVDSLEPLVRQRLMPVLRDRVQIESWALQRDQTDAVTAGYLAIAGLTGRRQLATIR